MLRSEGRWTSGILMAGLWAQIPSRVSQSIMFWETLSDHGPDTGRTRRWPGPLVTWTPASHLSLSLSEGSCSMALGRWVMLTAGKDFRIPGKLNSQNCFLSDSIATVFEVISSLPNYSWVSYSKKTWREPANLHADGTRSGNRIFLRVANQWCCPLPPMGPPTAESNPLKNPRRSLRWPPSNKKAKRILQRDHTWRHIPTHKVKQTKKTPTDDFLYSLLVDTARPCSAY